MYKNWLLISLVILFISSCSTIQLRKNQSSGLIGCKPEEISIKDEVPSGYPTWTAICNGISYACSSTNMLVGSGSTNCTRIK